MGSEYWVDKAKPCPFCAGKAKVRILGYEQDMQASVEKIRIKCGNKDCGASIQGGLYPCDTLERWNRRI
jgi:hypothetical protein